METDDGSRIGNVLMGATAVLVVLYVVSVAVDSIAPRYADTALADEIALLQAVTSGSLHLYALAVVALVVVGGYYYRRTERQAD